MSTWRKVVMTLVGVMVLLALPQCTGNVPGKEPVANPPPGTPSGLSSQVPAPKPGDARPIAVQAPMPAGPNEVRFGDYGYTEYGDWWAEATMSPATWQPGSQVKITSTLRVTDSYLDALAAAKIKTDGFALLATAERSFDADGWLRLPSDERMSTLITPTGLAIEGGTQGAVTNRFGAYDFRTPLDEFVTVPFAPAQRLQGGRTVTFTIQARLPDTLPPGIYRVRLDYGLSNGKTYRNLNCEGFARRPFFKGRATESHLYSPPIRASGTHVTGNKVDATQIKPRVPWVILGDYNSNGYRGVVANEDRGRFALSDRNLIPDDVILPRYADDGKTVLSYNLEPAFPADIIEARSNIPWDYAKGELSIKVTGPDGKTADLGTFPYAGKRGNWPTTKKPAFTAWKPPAYGRYSVKVTGWIADIWGNRYEGGGTYEFWIAKRMTMATATFQGQAYPVGNRYGRDMGFAPAVPADIEVTATLFVNSDPKQPRTVTYSGKASPSGIFGAAQGLKPLPFDAPGEYNAYVLAKYTDKDGHLWVSSMRHAGVIFSEDSPIEAHGKKLYQKGQFVDRAETNFEGWIESADVTHLDHITYPYLQGDALLIASEGQGANKIEPVLTYEYKGQPLTNDQRNRLRGVGTSNIQLKTSNGYSPHLFPEYITEWNYFYAGAPRPGFMSRFIVGEDGLRAPYWPTSNTNFGGQINASNNGDQSGDIYRLIGGVVVRKQGQAPLYAGYIASAFILPGGTKNNRVIAAGSQDVPGPYSKWTRFFLVGLRPGMMFEAGTAFAAAAQIDPILPANLRFVLKYPDGRVVVTEGPGDKTGSWVGKDRWTLDVPGVYTYTIEGEWQGFKGYMPGLPAEGGFMYVVEKDQPANAPALKLNLPVQTSFAPDKGISITGTSTGQEVYYAAVIPGAVIDQGVVPVVNGKFEYFFNPAAIHDKTPTYEILNYRSGKPEIKDVVHLTLFSKETGADGKSYHTFVRLIIRGNTILHTR